MAHDQPESIEQRLTMLEAELRQAKERVRAFEIWRKRLGRTCIITAGAVASFLLVALHIVPASGNGPTIFKGPVYFEDTAGKKLVSINDPTDQSAKSGGIIAVWSKVGGHSVARLGATSTGVGALVLTIPDEKRVAQMSFDANGDPLLEFQEENKIVAELAEGANKFGMGLRIWNSAGSDVADLQVNTHERGLLTLADENADIRVEAGTNEDGAAVVTVAGAQGKCLPIGPIACELMSR